jgi:glycosyltransferase involved in cell wall biosynthesis
MAEQPVHSVVVPVFNSEGSVRELVERTLRVFEGLSLPVEIILVNDVSADGSWEVLESLATEHFNVRAIDLLKNYGQHSAILCGLRHTSGEYVILLDDDLQNPPDEIPKLLEKASEGHDLVFGQFQKKRHAMYRRWGSFIIGLINRHIFHQPKHLVVTNFPILHRSVVDRVCSYRSIQPYIPGLSLMYATKPGNVLVEHHERSIGSSNYNLVRITRLVM